MRINRLSLENFKLFERVEFEFHPQFNLLVGANGSGKTSVLDGLAVALGIWLVRPPDPSLNGSRRNIHPQEIRLAPVRRGDRTQFRRVLPVRVTATGDLNGQHGVCWTREVREGSTRTSNADADRALTIIQTLYRRDAQETQTLPILANYGAGRAWLPSNERVRPSSHAQQPAFRWDALYDCFSERIRGSDLVEWFRRETTAAGSRGGRARPGFEAVKLAIQRCLPGATNLWYDDDSQDIIAMIDDRPNPFSILSAGQRVLLATVGDIAIRAVTQNAHLLPPDDLDGDAHTLPSVLAETPGVVLIDELDVHLHPEWQRGVPHTLMGTFPQVQFFCTTHSPQVVGEASPETVFLLGADAAVHPTQAVGMDSNWILEHLMHAAPRDRDTLDRLVEIYRAIDAGELLLARRLAGALEERLGVFPDLQAALSLLDRLELLEVEEDQ